MLFQRINRSDPEKIFIVVKAGEALVQSHPACFQFAPANTQGLTAMAADAATDETAVIGIIDGAIASGEYGLVQCYGYRSDCYALGGSVQAVNSGGYYGVRSGSSGHLIQISSSGVWSVGLPFPPFIAAHSTTVATTNAIALVGVFIRCM